MLDATTITTDYLDAAKRHLKITWSDDVTDQEVWEKMCRAEYVLNAKIGAEIDYFSAPSWEQSVYFNYLLYMWNNCESDFDAAYANDILQLRALYALAEDEEEEDDSEEEEEDEE